MTDIILDVDGVVADYVVHVLNILGLTHIDPRSVKTTFEDTLKGEDREKYEKLVANPEFWLTIPVIADSQNGVERLRTRGLNVHWCSSPFDTAPLWHWARTKWLKKNFNSDLSDFTATKEKWRVGGQYFADDTPDHIKTWVTHNGGKAFLFDQPHNRDFNEVPRVNWDTITAYIA